MDLVVFGAFWAVEKFPEVKVPGWLGCLVTLGHMLMLA